MTQSEQLEIRSFSTDDIEIRSVGKYRMVEGIVVPFGVAKRIDQTLVEQFATGAFDHQSNAVSRIKFTRDHQSQGGSIIGHAVEMRNDAKGLFMRFQVDPTERGNETVILLEGGSLTDLSVGFHMVSQRVLPTGVVERTKAHLFEVSVVPEGAYGEDALVTAVRADQANSRMSQAKQILATWPVLPPLA